MRDMRDMKKQVSVEGLPRIILRQFSKIPKNAPKWYKSGGLSYVWFGGFYA
jgi:hypothetical protein